MDEDQNVQPVAGAHHNPLAQWPTAAYELAGAGIDLQIRRLKIAKVKLQAGVKAMAELVAVANNEPLPEPRIAMQNEFRASLDSLRRRLTDCESDLAAYERRKAERDAPADDCDDLADQSPV